MHQERGQFGLAVYHDFLYAFGGYGHRAEVTNTVEVYDPATDTWTFKAPPPPLVGTTGSGSWVQAATVGDKIYVFTNVNELDRGRFSIPAPGSVRVYDPATDQWSDLGRMPTARGDFSIGVVNNTIYVVGGWRTTQDTILDGERGWESLTLVEAYDPATNSWTTKAPMLHPRAGFGVGVVNGTLYVVGGGSHCYPGCYSGAVEAYDPATNAWTSKAKMLTPRDKVGVGVLNGIIYAIGGDDGVGPLAGYGIISTVEAFDPSTNTWSPSPPTSTLKSLGPGIGTVRDILFAVGGAVYDGAIATVEAFKF
jgi:N-acetylneuraminic acid mutarotase